MILKHCNGKNLIIGYNTHEFDFKFIWEAIRNYPAEELNEDLESFSPSHSLDLYQLFRGRSPFGMLRQRETLLNCYKTFHGGNMTGAHNAAYDALACIKMLASMKNYYKLPNGRAKIKQIMREFPNEVSLMSLLDLLKKEQEIMDRH
jgi:hypothetical protein